MILYLSIIFIAMVIIALINIFILGFSPWLVILMVVGTTAFQFAIDGIFALLVERLPNKWFDINKKNFQVSQKERGFYDFLKIRKWKDKVWELGGMGGFRKNKLADPGSPEYIESFIIHSNKGIVDHWIGCFAGFLCVLIIPFEYALSIAVPVACVNFILNLLPIFILRYNVPKLQIALKRLKKQTEMKEQKENQDV